MSEKIYTQSEVNELLELLKQQYEEQKQFAEQCPREFNQFDIRCASNNQWAIVAKWAESAGHVPDDEIPAPVVKTPQTPNDTGEEKPYPSLLIGSLESKVKVLEADNNRWKAHAAEREGQAATLNARLEDMTDLCETMRAEIIDLRERTFSRKEMKGALKLLAVQWFEKMARINVRDSEIPF